MGRKKSKGNGEGTVYKDAKTGRHIAQYVVNGSRKSLYQRKNENVGDFKARFNKIINSINEGTYTEKSSQTLYEILERHIKQKFENGITSPNSYLKDTQTLKGMVKTCPNFIYKPVQKITTEDIEDASVPIREAYSQEVIDKMWAFLKKAFKIAYSRRKILYNIMEDETLIKPISEKEKRNIIALTSKELAKLNSVLDNQERNHPYRNIVKMQLELSARIGEVLARSIFDVDKEKKNTLLIDNTLTKDENSKIILGKHTKTYNKRTGIDSGKRNFPMNDTIRAIIKEQQEAKITNIYGLIFWDYDNDTFISYAEVNSWLKRINEKYKISSKELSTHVLRKTGITEMRKAGMDIKVIQHLVGHIEGSEITDKDYTNVDDEFVTQEMNKLYKNTM